MSDLIEAAIGAGAQRPLISGSASAIGRNPALLITAKARSRPKRRARLPLLAAIACAAFLAGCDESEPTTRSETVRPVLTAVVGDVERFITDSYPGRAKAATEANLGFEVSGRLITRTVDVGDEVAAGEVLATLDPEPFMARIRTLQGERAALEAALADAETDLQRNLTLLERDFVSQARVDDQQMLVNAEKAKIEAIDGALDAARLRLAYTEMTAPFDGVISATFVENFQNVVAKQPVLRIVDTTRIEMDVSVPESLIGLAGFVEEVTVTFNSLPGVEVPAKVKNVGAEASLTTRTYPVTLVMDQPEGARIQPGMSGRATARARLPEGWDGAGIEVPAPAVFTKDGAAEGETSVWVVDEGEETVRARDVEVMSLGARGLRVKGLAAGDRIVVAGANSLSEGQKVRLAAD